MHRWTARIALLLMLVPIVGPLAMALAAGPDGRHCARRPLASTPAPTVPAMHCHQAATANASSEEAPASTQASFRSRDCCCDHDCCRGLTTSEWAQAVEGQSFRASLMIEFAPATPVTSLFSSPFRGSDSTRAPPRA